MRTKRLQTARKRKTAPATKRRELPLENWITCGWRINVQIVPRLPIPRYVVPRQVKFMPDNRHFAAVTAIEQRSEQPVTL